MEISIRFLALVGLIFCLSYDISGIDAGPSSLKCPPVCDIFCIYGNVLDKNGCPTCACKKANDGELPNKQPIHHCPPTCDIFCERGKQKDEHGCDLCKCRH